MTPPRGPLSRLSGPLSESGRPSRALPVALAALWLPGAALAVPYGGWAELAWFVWCAGCGWGLYRHIARRASPPPLEQVAAALSSAPPSLVQPLPMPACLIDPKTPKPLLLIFRVK